MLTISSESLEYVRVPIEAKEDGEVVDPTGDMVEMAFIKLVDPDDMGEPTSADWNMAEWETDSGDYFARCLVGPAGTAVLDEGDYAVWVRIFDTPERPVRRSGTLTVI